MRARACVRACKHSNFQSRLGSLAGNKFHIFRKKEKPFALAENVALSDMEEHGGVNLHHHRHREQLRQLQQQQQQQQQQLGLGFLGKFVKRSSSRSPSGANPVPTAAPEAGGILGDSALGSLDSNELAENNEDNHNMPLRPVYGLQEVTSSLRACASGPVQGPGVPSIHLCAFVSR